jgi:hypothetical protein
MTGNNSNDSSDKGDNEVCTPRIIATALVASVFLSNIVQAAEKTHIGVTRGSLVNLSTAQAAITDASDCLSRIGTTGASALQRIGAKQLATTFYQVPSQTNLLITDISWRSADDSAASGVAVMRIASFNPDTFDQPITHYESTANVASAGLLISGRDHLTTPIRIGADRVVCAALTFSRISGASFEPSRVFITGYHNK